jgi:pimeloyl-ACP methyl ester carboxylesterase
MFHRSLAFLLLAVSLVCLPARAHPLHADVLVFVPAYEGSQLFDDTLNPPGDPACVWGNINTFLSSRLYFCLRMPNPLRPETIRAVGPVDVYGHFLTSMTSADADVPGFAPYTVGADFFIFDYDWRQDMATVSAPLLGRALEHYAAMHAALTGIPADQTRFVLVAHSMGGLVTRTLLSEQPAWAPRVRALYLVGSPNGGSVKAIKTVVYGPDSLKSHAHGFPGVLLNLIPTSVDQNVTKLTGITRPSLYELLPTGDPHWTRMIDGRQERVTDAFATEPWRRYWPTAKLEERVFIDGWLKARMAERRKSIDAVKWIFCRDDSALDRLMAQARTWRATMGPLARTASLLTAPDGATRLRLIAGIGLATPDGVITDGDHDTSQGTYLDDGAEGDGTVELARVLEGTPRDASNVKLLPGVTHGKLMGSHSFLAYFHAQLAGGRLVSPGR